MRALILSLVACSTVLAGCGNLMSRDSVSQGVSAEVARSDQMSYESLTLSRLTVLERSLSDYVRAKGKVPKRLKILIPEYLAGIPEALLGVKGHKDSNEVHYYSPDVISGGIINGSLIKDQGGWGYAFNGRRVIIFANCTHQAASGRAWYQLGSGLGLGSKR